MSKSLKAVLMERDGLSEKEALEHIALAKDHLQQRMEDGCETGIMPFDFCEEEFGLEPDYLEELL